MLQVIKHRKVKNKKAIQSEKAGQDQIIISHTELFDPGSKVQHLSKKPIPSSKSCTGFSKSTIRVKKYSVVIKFASLSKSRGKERIKKPIHERSAVLGISFCLERFPLAQ
jgi:hypothetical protein